MEEPRWMWPGNVFYICLGVGCRAADTSRRSAGRREGAKTMTVFLFHPGQPSTKEKNRGCFCRPTTQPHATISEDESYSVDDKEHSFSRPKFHRPVLYATAKEAGVLQ